MSVNNTEDEKRWRRRNRDCSSGDAVAARNGLWVMVRYKPYCAAAANPENTTWLSPIGSTCGSFSSDD